MHFSNFDEKSYDLSAYYVPTYKKCIGLRRLKYKKKGNDGYFSMYNTLHSTFRVILKLFIRIFFNINNKVTFNFFII